MALWREYAAKCDAPMLRGVPRFLRFHNILEFRTLEHGACIGTELSMPHGHGASYDPYA